MEEESGGPINRADDAILDAFNGGMRVREVSQCIGDDTGRKWVQEVAVWPDAASAAAAAVPSVNILCVTLGGAILVQFNRELLPHTGFRSDDALYFNGLLLDLCILWATKGG